MPLPNILILIGIVLTFVVFGVALAWGEYQTRHLDRDTQSRDAVNKPTDLKRAA